MSGYNPAGYLRPCPLCDAKEEALDVAAREVLKLRDKVRFLEDLLAPFTRDGRKGGPAMCQADGFAEEEFGTRTSD